MCCEKSNIDMRKPFVPLPPARLGPPAQSSYDTRSMNDDLSVERVSRVPRPGAGECMANAIADHPGFGR
jgi:hypothetical protein